MGVKSVTPVVAALAGRRIDNQDTDKVRFPLFEAENVFNKLVRRFRQESIDYLVCSAACGADILALEAAEKLAVPAIIVLPFSSHTFRKISVTDRPGNWGERFDNVVKLASDRGNLVELGFDVDDDNSFSKTNSRIIQEALTLGLNRKLAFVVWEGKSRGKGDSTADFMRIALSQGFEKKTVLTVRRGC